MEIYPPLANRLGIIFRQVMYYVILRTFLFTPIKTIIDLYYVARIIIFISYLLLCPNRPIRDTPIPIL